MIEIIIIKHLLNKESYNKYRKFVKVIDKPLELLYSVLDKLHDSLDRDVTLDEYKYSVLQQDGTRDLQVKQIVDAKVGQDVVETMLKTLCERQWAHSLALVSIAVSEGTKDVSELFKVYDEIESILVKPDAEDLFLSDDFEALHKDVDRAGGLRWRLPFLNASIGGLHKGDFGFVFARTNVGKTTFLASEVSFMLTQTEKPVIWMNNEEGGARIKFRVMQAFFGIEMNEIESDIRYYQGKFLSETQGRFKFYDPMGGLHKKQIEQVAKEYNPGLIIIDNLDKVNGFKADREDLVLGKTYTWARELAKPYCPVIAVCQAGASAENKKWLQNTDAANAHTSKQSESDFIIGIGATHNVGEEEIRYINIPKNKFQAGVQKYECRIKPYIARYEEI